MKRLFPTSWLFVIALGLMSGCERSPTSQPAPPNAAVPAAVAPANVVEFVPPDASTDKLPFAVQTKIGAARTILRRTPEEVGKTMELGALYYAHGLAPAAVACFQHLTQLKPDRFEPWYYLGLAAQAAGDAPAAQSAYDKVIALTNGPAKSDGAAKEPYAPAVLRLALLLTETDAQRAAGLFQGAVKDRPDAPVAHYGLGKLARAAGKTDDAVGHFRRAVEADADYGPAGTALAELLKAQGKSEEAAARQTAVDANTRLIPNDPLEIGLLLSGMHVPTLLERARAALAQRDFAGAEQALRTAHEVSPPATNELYGELYLGQGKLADAVRVYREQVRDEPNNVRAQASLALALGLAQDAEAEPLLQKLIAAHPADPDVLERLCRLRMQQQRTADALAVLKPALAAAAKDPDVQYRVALLLVQLGDADAAQAALRKAVELRPTFSAARWQIGLLLAQKSDMEGAAREWRELLQLDPAHTAACEALAQVQLQQRDFPGAERTLRECLERHPKAIGLQNALAWLLATSPVASQRRGAEAVTLAEQAVAGTRRSDPGMLDTLAAAYAEVGQFEDARRAIAEAIRVANNLRVNQQDAASVISALVKYKARQRRYWKNQPYHEE